MNLIDEKGEEVSIFGFGVSVTYHKFTNCYTDLIAIILYQSNQFFLATPDLQNICNISLQP